MELKEMQQTIDSWIVNYGVRYFDETTNTLLLMEEVGELSRLIARKYGDQSFKREEEKRLVDTKIREEIADILFVLTCLSNQMKIDMESAIRESLLKKTKRDALRHKKNEKLR